MTDLFDSQFVTRMKCLNCGNQTYSFDNNMDLNIEIPKQQGLNNVTLNDCFDKFTAIEQVADFQCSHCKKKVVIEKDYSIYRFPSILVVHLKRFYQVSHNKREKLETVVRFPEILDIQKYAPYSSHASKKDAMYTLFGITHHSGTMSKGHYISEVLSQSDMKWYKCNDSIIEQISQPSTSSQSAYILYYAM